MQSGFLFNIFNLENLFLYYDISLLVFSYFIGLDLKLITKIKDIFIIITPIIYMKGSLLKRG